MTSPIQQAIDALALAKECGGELDQDQYRCAHDALQRLAEEIRAHDDAINQVERVPTGHDYNWLFGALGPLPARASPPGHDPEDLAVAGSACALTGAGVVDLERAVREAADLGAMASSEYVRGVAELLARCFPVADMSTGDRAEQVSAMIRQVQTGAGQ